MPLFGLRDLISAYPCPSCGSSRTVRTDRQKDGTRIIQCKKCLYHGPVRAKTDVRASFQSDEANNFKD